MWRLLVAIFGATISIFGVSNLDGGNLFVGLMELIVGLGCLLFFVFYEPNRKEKARDSHQCKVAGNRLPWPQKNCACCNDGEAV